MSEMAEEIAGAAFTVTVKVSEIVPPLPSLAVTVMVDTPRALAVIVRAEPSEAASTVATDPFEDVAVIVSESPSASSNTPSRETVLVPVS